MSAARNDSVLPSYSTAPPHATGPSPARPARSTRNAKPKGWLTFFQVMIPLSALLGCTAAFIINIKYDEEPGYDGRCDYLMLFPFILSMLGAYEVISRCLKFTEQKCPGFPFEMLKIYAGLMFGFVVAGTFDIWCRRFENRTMEA